MSSLTGIAQFTNQFAKNIMGYDQDKKDEAERVADKQYNRNRQAQQDKNAQETHDVNYQSDTLKLEDEKDTRNDTVNKRNYGKAFNKVEYFKNLGDESGAIDAIVEGANSHSDLPYKINVDRDAHGKVASRTDENGNKYYFQNIIDKDTGKVMRTDSVTYDQLMNGYKQLQNGQSIAAEKAAYEAEKRKETEKDQRELTLYGGKKRVDVQADGIKAERDHGYDVSLEGLKFNNQVKRDENLQGYAIDKQNNQAGHAQQLAYIQGELAAGRIDQQAYNRMEEYIYKAGVDQGQTPKTGGSWGQFSALIKPESGGQQFNSKGQPLTSSAGAIGIAQVIPATAEATAKKHGIKWDANAYKTDANYNYKLGEMYFNDQMKTYGGDPVLAYAAYNAGPGAVNGWLGLKGSNQSKYKAIPGFANMTTQQKINAIPFAETRNYVAKIHRQSSGVQTTLTQPLAPKPPKSAGGNITKQAESGKGIATKTDYNANVDKGFSKALTLGKSYGIKANAGSSSQLSQASNKVKSFAAASSYEEVSSLYAEAVNLAVKSIPDRDRKKLSNEQKKDIGEKLVLTMAGASSQANLLETLYRVNPSARPNAKGSGKTVSASGLTLNLPGQQPNAPARQTPQTGKLQALSLRGLPAVKTDPKATENLNYLENLNDNMDW